jgi:hypothetical protein
MSKQADYSYRNDLPSISRTRLLEILSAEFGIGPITELQYDDVDEGKFKSVYGAKYDPENKTIFLH